MNSKLFYRIGDELNKAQDEFEPLIVELKEARQTYKRNKTEENKSIVDEIKIKHDLAKVKFTTWRTAYNLLYITQTGEE